jgi:general secretion pathway protein J
VTARMGEDGFTLLELLVATTLLAFLSVALVAGMRFGTRLWGKTESGSIEAIHVRTAQTELAVSLDRLYPRFVVDGDKAYVDFDGASDRMDFLSAAGAGSGQMQRVSLRTVRDGDALDLQYNATPELSRDGRDGRSRILARGLRAVAIDYFGSVDGTAAAVWRADWTRERKPPELVRIRAAFAKGSARWPEMVLKPRIAADMSCQYDALTKFCQGR